MKGITSGVVKEGDILVVEGGVARHIINPKKRGEKVAGAYATAYNENLLPSTVFVDAKDIAEGEKGKVEAMARQKVTEQVSGAPKPSPQKPVPQKAPAQQQKPADVKWLPAQNKAVTNAGSTNSGTTKVNAKVISVSAPEFEEETQVVVAVVEGPKGRYNVVTSGKHGERLIALEGHEVWLEMKTTAKNTPVFSKKYKAYEASEVHFSEQRIAVKETMILLKGNNFIVLGREGKEAKIVAHDLETMQDIEANVEKPVSLVLESFGDPSDGFVVTDVTPLAKDEAQASLEEKVS